MDINEIWVICVLFFFFGFWEAHLNFTMGPMHYLWNSQTSLFNKIFIKNGSHGTIHTFKNYFATIFSIFCNPFFPTDHDYHHLTIGYEHGSCAHQMAWQLGIKQIIKWVSLSHHNQVLFLQIDPKSFCPSQFGLYQKHQTPMPLGLVKLRPSFITLNFSWTLCFLWWKHSLLTNQE